MKRKKGTKVYRLMLVREEAANQHGLAPPTQPAPDGVVAALPPHAGNCSLMRPSCLGRKRIKNYSTPVAEGGAVSLLRRPKKNLDREPEPASRRRTWRKKPRVAIPEASWSRSWPERIT